MAVDLLVEVDNSGSMAQEQANLTQSFGTIVDGLGQLTRADVIDDLHLGVISTDMGTGGFAVQTCRDAVDGDDGILRSTASGSVAGCDPEYPLYLSWTSGDDPSAVQNDFACLSTLGTGGCGFEQHLKAVRKALTVHRDGANADFLRDDSFLAIVILSDEEDCSVREDTADATDIFNTQLALGPLNLRCYNHRDQYVEPLQTYVQELLAVRTCPQDLAVFGILGVPPDTRHACDLSGMSDADFQCLLDLPEMQEVIDNSAEGHGERLTPSCDEAGLGEAFPPRRIVELLQQLGRAGAATGVTSICQDDYSRAFSGIVDALQARAGL